MSARCRIYQHVGKHLHLADGKNLLFAEANNTRPFSAAQYDTFLGRWWCWWRFTSVSTPSTMTEANANMPSSFVWRIWYSSSGVILKSRADAIHVLPLIGVGVTRRIGDLSSRWNSHGAVLSLEIDAIERQLLLAIAAMPRRNHDIVSNACIINESITTCDNFRRFLLNHSGRIDSMRNWHLLALAALHGFTWPPSE